MYLLQKVNRLPDSLINRLLNYGEFQGARYEVAIAAAFVKCGFEIEWIDDVTAKHPEFVARNPRTREEVAVETKSRRRPGVLHQPGTMAAAEQLRADVDRLYREALQQDPGNRPFAIFLDVNLPPNTTPDVVAAWQREIVARWQSNEQIALLGFTNFAWHYSGAAPSRPPEFLLSVPLKSARPLASAETIECLRLALDTYGVCANEY
jgi:nucleoid DNA-binding protein